MLVPEQGKSVRDAECSNVGHDSIEHLCQLSRWTSSRASASVYSTVAESPLAKPEWFCWVARLLILGIFALSSVAAAEVPPVATPPPLISLEVLGVQAVGIADSTARAVVHFAVPATAGPAATTFQIWVEKPDCGCIQAVLNRDTYAPGDGGLISISYLFNQFSGLRQFDLVVHVRRAEGLPQDQRLPLQVRFQIPEVVHVDPPVLTWAPEEGQRPKS